MADAEENRILQFRCAETGRRFIVVFVRQPPAKRFRIANVIDEGEVAGSGGLDGTVKLLQGSVQRMLVPLPSIIADTGRLVQRIFSAPAKDQALEKVQPEADEEPPEIPLPPPPPPPRRNVDEFTFDDFDFTGWYCPCCGHAKQGYVIHRFIRCGKCREYICGARVSNLPDGRVSFRCHDRCRNTGILGEGTLKSLHGLGVEVDKQGQLPGKSARLPAPGQSLPPGKKPNK